MTDGSKSILLIEDDFLIQRSLQRLLEKRGANVNVFSSGNEAIPAIINNNYHRIICDLMLQDISGFDVIEEAKQKYSLDEISKLFVIITAYSSNTIIEKVRNYGCTVVTKPFDDLNAALDTFLGININDDV